MASGYNQQVKNMAGIVNEVPTVFANSDLGLTPVKVTLCAASLGQIRRIKISNLSTAAANGLAWQIVTAGAAAPTFVATPAPTAGVIIAAGQVEYFGIPQGCDLYIVGAAASTSYCVTSFSI